MISAQNADDMLNKAVKIKKEHTVAVNDKDSYQKDLNSAKTTYSNLDSTKNYVSSRIDSRKSEISSLEMQNSTLEKQLDVENKKFSWIISELQNYEEHIPNIQNMEQDLVIAESMIQTNCTNINIMGANE